MAETYVQRMHVTFATDDTVKYVGHLDMARAWERAIRRARLPLAYSQGFNPQARCTSPRRCLSASPGRPS